MAEVCAVSLTLPATEKEPVTLAPLSEVRPEPLPVMVPVNVGEAMGARRASCADKPVTLASVSAVKFAPLAAGSVAGNTEFGTVPEERLLAFRAVIPEPGPVMVPVTPSVPPTVAFVVTTSPPTVAFDVTCKDPAARPDESEMESW